MPTINNYVAMGHMVAPPQLKTLKSGYTVSNFTLAVNTGKNETLFLDCTAFKEQAEWIDGTDKGALMAIEGRLVQDQWEDQNTGQKRSKIKCLCHRVHYCRDAYRQGPPQSTDEEQSYDERQQAQGDADQQNTSSDSEQEDIPF